MNVMQSSKSLCLFWRNVLPSDSGWKSKPSQQQQMCELLTAWNASSKVKYKSKAILVTGLGGLYGCEMLRIPHCLDNRLTVNCKILAICSSTYSPVRTSQEAYSVSIK
jgi:hypothetical protein